jgi:predicted hydrolase (HD superfamily)
VIEIVRRAPLQRGHLTPAAMSVHSVDSRIFRLGIVENELVAWAQETAKNFLNERRFAPARWPHVQAMGAKAASLAPALGQDGPILIAAAWLHDIGYSAQLASTGFHPLDGARWLRDQGQKRLAGLVAHHSRAAREAELRGLSAELAEFVDERTPVRDALWACDMTTSPVGEPVTFDERMAEIEQRYGPEHTVTRSIADSTEEIRRAIDATALLARQAGIEEW